MQCAAAPPSGPRETLRGSRACGVGGRVARTTLIRPLPAHKARRIRDYCLDHGLKLDLSHAYSDSLSDYPMLAVVGRPTAVNPDPRLRAHARAYEWPILDLR